MDDRAYDKQENTAAPGGVRALPEASSIFVDDEGRYCWRGTIDLHENPTILLLIVKIMAGIMGFIALVLASFVLLDVLRGKSIYSGDVWMLVKIYALVLFAVTIITAIAYYGYAMFLGWSYSADYLMDETGLIFQAAPKEAKVLKDVAKATALITAMIGRYGLTAASIAGSSDKAASRFSRVFRVKGIREHQCIKVSEPFLYNQVYVTKRDYDFVYGFIRDHCPRAKCVEVK